MEDENKKNADARYRRAVWGQVEGELHKEIFGRTILERAFRPLSDFAQEAADGLAGLPRELALGLVSIPERLGDETMEYSGSVARELYRDMNEMGRYGTRAYRGEDTEAKARTVREPYSSGFVSSSISIAQRNIMIKYLEPWEISLREPLFEGEARFAMELMWDYGVRYNEFEIERIAAEKALGDLRGDYISDLAVFLTYYQRPVTEDIVLRAAALIEKKESERPARNQGTRTESPDVGDPETLRPVDP